MVTFHESVMFVSILQDYLVIKIFQTYDEVWVLQYIPVQEEGHTQLIDSFTEIKKLHFLIISTHI